MNDNFIELSAYVEGQEISWKLNPSPKTLYKEIHEFASSICEFCKICIRNQIASEQTKNSTISVTILCVVSTDKFENQFGG